MKKQINTLLSSVALCFLFGGNAFASNSQNDGMVAATYWSAWGGNTSYNVDGKQIKSNAIDLDKIDARYNIIIVAFITYDQQSGHYQLDTQGQYTSDQIKKFVQTAKMQGRKVLVSLGGALFQWGQGDLVDDVQKIINDYGFQGLDIDLEGSAIDPSQAGNILTIVKACRSENPDFMLTAAPEWPYITPFTYGSGQWASHALAGDQFIKFINTIGLDNFTYIWPQTYNQGPSNGLTGHDTSGDIKVTPEDGMDKFLAAFAWATSTPEGYKANGSIGLFIPSSKLVLGIPATEGAAGGGMMYVATPAQIQNAWSLMQSQKTIVKGFMDWSVDWDALDIKDGQLSNGYSHVPWATIAAIGALNKN